MKPEYLEIFERLSNLIIVLGEELAKLSDLIEKEDFR